MARMYAVCFVIAVGAVCTVNSQYLGFPYATTATSFSLPFIGGFGYAPAIAPVGPVLKAAAPFAGIPYGAPFAPGVGPVVKAAYPYAGYGYGAPVLKTAFPFAPTVVKTAVPAIAPVVKAVPFGVPGPFPLPAPAGPFPFPAAVGPVAPGPVAAPVPTL